MINIFVFDTNSLISAHLIPNSVSAKAFDKANEFGILVYTKDSLRVIRIYWFYILLKAFQYSQLEIF